MTRNKADHIVAEYNFMVLAMSAGDTVSMIEPIRVASRRLVRELGFTSERFADSDLSPSSVHALIEIESGGLTGSDISRLLRLEKSSVSRMLRKLSDAGLISESQAQDRRSKTLALTSSGEVCVHQIHAFARRQISKALERLTPAQQQQIVDGIALYASALGDGASRIRSPVRIRRVDAYQPGIIAQITKMHIEFYSRSVGFGQPFEAGVAGGLAEFSARMQKPMNSIWLALENGTTVGSIAIDGEDLGEGTAHLRWFIVGEATRGLGVGRNLLQEALRFVDSQQFSETHLWTFKGLDSARYLYETHGFDLVEERIGMQWGNEMLEQRFVRIGM